MRIVIILLIMNITDNNNNVTSACRRFPLAKWTRRDNSHRDSDNNSRATILYRESPVKYYYQEVPVWLGGMGPYAL